MPHAADRLIDAITRCAAPVCVGIDPVLERLPRTVRGAGGERDSPSDAVASVRSFVLGVLDAVAAHVPCVKFQSACFERYGHLGVRALAELMSAARERGLEVILDAKRGDIGLSAEHYAAAAFGAAGSAPAPVDWITVNGYLGADGIEPFLRPDRGAFVLVRTSNPGGDAIQTRKLADGRTVAECVAGVVSDLGASRVGTHGFSALGAVVGATKAADAERLREIMPRQIFLVPGFGAQGGGADDVKPMLDASGRGVIVTASRSVIYAGDPDSAGWTGAVADAARDLAEVVGRVCGLR